MLLCCLQSFLPHCCVDAGKISKGAQALDPPAEDDHLFTDDYPAEEEEEGEVQCGQDINTTAGDSTPEDVSRSAIRPPRKKLFSPNRRSPYKNPNPSERKRSRCGCCFGLERAVVRQERFERVLRRVCVCFEKVNKEMAVVKKYCMSSRPVIEANVSKTALACREIALLQEQNSVRMGMLEAVREKNNYVIDEVQGLADFIDGGLWGDNLEDVLKRLEKLEDEKEKLGKLRDLKDRINGCKKSMEELLGELDH